MEKSKGDREQIKVETIKCMVVGDSKTGKTCVYNRLLGKSIPSEYSPTVFDVTNKEIEHNGDKLTLTMWDSAGSNVYDSIRPISYAHTDCFIVCYRGDDNTSYKNVEERWLPEIRQHGDGPRVPIILIETKHGIPTSKECEGENAQAVGQAFFQFSTSMSDEDVHKILQKMAELACQKKVEEEKPPNPIWKFLSLNVIITGDIGVGKTSLIEACIRAQNEEKPRPKTGNNYKLQEYYHDFVSDGCEYFLRIIELPFGNDYVGTLCELSEEADLIILCYAINDPFSFQTVDLHCRSILEHLSKNVPILLISRQQKRSQRSIKHSHSN